MRIDEFAKKINELGFKVNVDDDIIEVIGNSSYYGVMAIVSNTLEKVMDLNLFLYHNLDEDTKSKVFDLVTELAKTPIEDREEEKKFYLKHKYFRHVNDKQYFMIYPHLEYPQLDYKLPSHNLVQTFTLKEIEVIKKKYNTDLSDFEKKEVKE